MRSPISSLPSWQLKQWLHEFFFVMVPKVLGGGSTFVLNILLFRFFNPEQYGAYSLCIAAILLADGIFGSAIDLAVLRLAPLCKTENPARCQAIQQTALYFKLGLIGFFFSLSGFFASPLQRLLFSNKGEVSWLYWTTAAILGMLLLRSVQTHFQVEGQFSAFGKLELLHIIGKFTGVAIAIGLGKVTPGLILAFFAIAPISIAVLFLLFSREKFFRGREELSMPLVMEMVQFMKWFLVTTGISIVVAQLPNFTLTRWAGIHEVGIYSAGSTLSSVFPMLGLYLSILLSPRIMSFCRQGRFYSLYRILQRIFIIGALGIYLFFYLYVDVVARMLFPPSFASSKGIFMILLPAALSWLVTTPLVMTFVMFIRPKFIVVMESIIFPFLLFSYAWAISLHGAMGAAWVTLGFGLLRSGILQLAAWRWARRLPATGEGNWMAAEEPVIPPNLS